MMPIHGAYSSSTMSQCSYGAYVLYAYDHTVPKMTNLSVLHITAPLEFIENTVEPLLT